jgi:hypothetical protein
VTGIEPALSASEAAPSALGPVQAHVQAGGGAGLAGSGLDKITNLVDQPKAVTAQQLIRGGPVPGERIGDLAGVGYLADDLFSRSPDLHGSAAISVAQGVAGELADSEHQVGDARWREPGTLGPAGDEAANWAQVVTVVQRLGVRGGRGSAWLHRGGRSGGPRYLALAVSFPSLMTAGCVLAASAMTDPGSPVLP